jgi:peptidoglycan/LPS O-acetylase OafA/YrhL
MEQQPYGTKTRGRLSSLDGLRGIAAVAVVLYHFCCAFIPRAIPAISDHPVWLADTPLGLLTNGPFSVAIFFVLSGFVVSRAASKTTDPVFISVPLRYLRLALPATASVLLAWALLMVFPIAQTQLNAILPSPWDGFTYQQHIPSALTALWEGLVGEFRVGTTRFNNALWTMKIEALGSITIYLVYGLSRGVARKMIAAILLVISLLEPDYLCFLLGAFMMELWSRGRLRGISPRLALAAGLLLGFPSRGFVDRIGVTRIFKPWLLFTPGEHMSVIPPIAASLILYAVLNMDWLERFLSSRIPSFLGRISFPLYLVHVPLICTVFSAGYVWLRPTSGLAMSAWTMVFLTTSMALGSIGELLVDRPVLNAIKRMKTFWGGVRSKRASLQPA